MPYVFELVDFLVCCLFCVFDSLFWVFGCFCMLVYAVCYSCSLVAVIIGLSCDWYIGYLLLLVWCLLLVYCVCNFGFCMFM